jgi:hypothetical protein
MHVSVRIAPVCSSTRIDAAAAADAAGATRAATKPPSAGRRGTVDS